MDSIAELRKWVEGLSPSEKRHVTLLGQMRAGAHASQHMGLFEWLCDSVEGDPLPAGAPFAANLPSCVLRLKELILDSLRLQRREQGPDATLQSTIANLHILLERKLYAHAARLLPKAKRLAAESCRYLHGLQLLEIERRMLRSTPAADQGAALSQIAKEEGLLMQRLEVLQDLRDRHERLLLLVRYIAQPRDRTVDAELRQITDSEWVAAPEWLHGYTERALAVNILGIKHLIDRDPQAALARYAELLRAWRDQPAWIADQAPLLLTICNYFQTACFYMKMDWAQAREYLSLVPDFKALAPETARDFQRMLYHNQLTPALNTGNLDSVQALIPQIDAWLQAESAALSSSQILPFYHNFAVAEFLMGHHKQAFRYVQRILNMPQRKHRLDIREFALVLQAILQFEIGDLQLNEYLTRSGRRHFAKKSREMEFESGVLRCLERLMAHPDPGEQVPHLLELRASLDALAKQLPGTVPVLGLTETQLWVESKLQHRSITEVFLEAIRANLEAMGHG